MAGIDFSSYKTQPFFLHNNFEEFYQVYINNSPHIVELGEKLLKDCIKFQKEKETKIYEILGIDDQDWRKIGPEIFGVFNINENPENEYYIKNKLELFLKYFTKFINSEMKQQAIVFTKDYSLKDAKEDTNRSQEANQKIIEAANSFIKAYNDPIQQFKDWYNNSGFSKGEFDEDDLIFLDEIFKNSRKNRKKMLISGDDKKRLKYISEECLEEAIDFLYRTPGFISNLIGNIGESATNYYIQNKKNYEIIPEATSILSGEKGEKERKKTIIQKNIDFYENQTKTIKEELESNGIKITSNDKLLKFGLFYTTKSTGTLSKNLKADEIFTFKVVVEPGKFENTTFGISSKTAWSESSDTIKLYTGSFYSAFENVFKTTIVSAGITGEIVNFLIYIIFNSLGSGIYGSFNDGKIDREAFSGVDDFSNIKIKTNSKGEIMKKKDTGKMDFEFSNNSFFNQQVRPMYNALIQFFAYQWFTGGDSPVTHADFFSIYANEHHYFIPMSIILQAILDLGVANESEYLLKQNLLPDYGDKQKDPIKKDDYIKALLGGYSEMEKLGLDKLSGKKEGSDNSAGVTFNKEKLKELIKGPINGLI